MWDCKVVVPTDVDEVIMESNECHILLVTLSSRFYTNGYYVSGTS